MENALYSVVRELRHNPCSLSLEYAVLTRPSILSFQHTQHMDFLPIAITLTSPPGITTRQMVMLAATQRIQEPVVTGVMQMVPPVNLTCRQPLHLLRQWFSIQCALGNHTPFLSR